MAESVRQKQSRFAEMTVELFQEIKRRGWKWTYGDAYRDPRAPYGSRNSLHRQRLAIDINLFKPDARGYMRYCTRTEDHRELGELWELWGGSWGGRFRNPDGNHYSLEHRGRR